MLLGIAGIGVIGPGIAGWHDVTAILTRATGFDADADIPSAAPTTLPANERRRATLLTRMALQCCEDTLRACAERHPTFRSVFASSCGDLQTADQILHALTLPDRPVSPTRFQNSVHNAAAGYWSIARRDASQSISISAHDSTFSAGLLDAVSNVLTGGGSTLLIAYDSVAPPALRAFRPFSASFAVGLLLVATTQAWNIAVTVEEREDYDTMPEERLEALRIGTPAARSLPLLLRIAANRPGKVVLPYLDKLGVVVDVVTDARR